jgi:hypothetical protein
MTLTFFEYDADEEKRLKRMFSCATQSRRDYQDYGDLVMLDSTYKIISIACHLFLLLV